MSKGKSITLLSIVSVLVAIMLVMTFIRFPIGIHNYNSVLGAIELDYDVDGGTAYTLKLSKDNIKDVEDIDEVIKTIDYRLGELGYDNYSIKTVKSPDKDVEDYDIRIELMEKETTASDIGVAMQYGVVEFYGGTSANPTDKILTDVSAIKDARYIGSFSGVGENGENITQYGVTITFTDEAYEELIKAMDDASANSESYYLEIKMEESTTPLLSGSSAISKDYFVGKSLTVYPQSLEYAKQLALLMRTGGLEYRYEIDAKATTTVSSPYGQDVALKCVIAVSVLVVAIMVAFIVIYKKLGVIFALSTLLFILGETWMLIAVPGLILSIGGVFGIILATVLTAYGSFVIAKRIKDEYVNSQKTVKAAIKKGFRQSIVPIINTCVVSGIVAGLLFAFASGFIKGFAITFGIGVGVSLITNLLFTRMYSSLIFPLVKNKEKFLNFKREEA